jgi:hypothetical protein
MSMVLQTTPNTPALVDNVNRSMTKREQHLLTLEGKTYNAYYNGKMSYKLRGQAWKDYITAEFNALESEATSENIFKAVIDLYAENLVPQPEELRGFSNCVIPLLSRGEALVLVDRAGEPHFPEHFEMVSDGRYTQAVIYSRNLERNTDYVTFAYSDGRTRIFGKPIPDDLAAADKNGYMFIEEEVGNTLFRFALDDKGFGAQLAALQDRLNHSIIDQTVVAEMYARPFWYLLNVEKAPKNPFLPAGQQPDQGELHEEKTPGQGSGRIFTSSSDGPFGQLEPPTLGDMVSYHDSIVDKVPQGFGVPAHYLKPGTGTPPTGVALKVLSKRFNNRVTRMREDITPVLEELAALLGVQKTKEIKPEVKKDDQGNEIESDEPSTYEYELWNTEDDLLQESLDQHGINLSQMGYPIKYIAEVVTPGVDLDDYEEEGGLPADGPGAPDMTAMGQPGLPATPGQVQSYANNPGQRQRS